MNVRDIYNFIEISDTVATAGQPSAEQFGAARDAGYEIVVNLAPDGLETSLADERALLDTLGIEYHHIPVAWTEPRLDELERFERIMDAAGSRKTLVHCQANYRVTAFFSLYAQARLGWSESEADALLDRIWNSRPGYGMNETWKAFVDAARARIG